MKKAVIFLFAVAVLVASSQASFACSCGFPTVADALKRANAVFTGKVIAVESDGVTFKIEKSWKGVHATIIKVYVKGLGSSCDPGIRKGRRFIVYAYPGGHRIPLLSSYCGRTRVLEQADEDVRELNESASLTPLEAQQSLAADGAAACFSSNLFLSARMLIACRR